MTVGISAACRGRDKPTGAGSVRAWIGRAGLAVLLTVAACTPSLQPRSTERTDPAFKNEHFVTHDGLRLPLRRWAPNPKPVRAVVLALHGFNDYSNAFTDPAAVLAEHGIVTYAFDQRGFGATPHRGLWSDADIMIEDAANALRLVRERHPGIPVYLLGESMGGAVAMVAVTNGVIADIDGLVLVAPAMWPRDFVYQIQRGALWLAAHTMPALMLSGRGLGIKPSDNIEMLRALGRDPLVIKETRVDTVYGLMQLMDAAFDAAPNLTVPALILYGANEEVLPKSVIKAGMSRLPQPPEGRWRLAIYDRGYHMLLRDLQGRTVVEDIAAWMIDRSAALPSGADAAEMVAEGWR